MDDERMMILKMLEQGKITAEDATRLLDGIGAGGKSPKRATKEEHARSNDPSEKGFDFEALGASFIKKMDSLSRDFEPTLKKVTEVVVEKTATITEKIADALTSATTSTSTASSTPSSSTSTASSGASSALVLEETIKTTGNDMQMMGLNGYVSLKGYNGETLTVKILYKAKKSGATIKLVNLGNRYFVDYNENDFASVCLDILFPNKLFCSITAQTNNGKLSIETATCDSMKLSNLNNEIELKKITATNLEVEGNNGTLFLTELNAQNANIENINGNVMAHNLEISKMRLMTLSGDINLTMAGYQHYNNYLWSIESSNAAIKLNLPSTDAVAYNIHAHTALDSVAVRLSNLNYKTNDRHSVEAKSFHYDGAAKKVKLSVETSSAPIEIV